jgi:uncharacterized membrane protein
MSTSLAERILGEQPLTNVGDVERVGSTIAGVALLLGGLSRRSVAGRGVAVLGSALVARGLTGRCPVYERMGRLPQSYRRPVRVVEAMQVAVPPDQAYRAWRDLENLPRFMKHVTSVSTFNGRSHWTARFSGLPEVEWDAELIQDVPGKVISWRSVDASGPLLNSGSVTFFDLGPRGTGMRVEIGYYPPAGPVGKAIARLFSPITEQQVREDLRRFKALLESREIPTTAGQPSAAVREEERER